MHVRLLQVRNAAAGMESEVNDFARLARAALVAALKSVGKIQVRE